MTKNIPLILAAICLALLRPLIGKDDGTKIPAENVQRINKMTSEVVVAITSKEA